jgi:long-chain acyl-CoA synthetase
VILDRVRAAFPLARRGVGAIYGLTESGELTLVGRSKDVIIRGGEHVAAAHVEGCLLRHPAVGRVAAGELAHFEVPTAWWLRHDPLPETASGKVEKATPASDWRGSRKWSP